MNKTMVCIQLLQLLSTHDVMNKNALAEALEINPRNIIEYVKTLQDSGYDIVSKRGVYGGYQLNSSSMLPAIKLKEDEINILKASCSYLEKRPDFLDYQTYLRALSKILSNHTVDQNTNVNLTIIDRFPLAMPKEELLNRYNLFLKALDQHKKCEIGYLSTHNKVKSHIIHPYKVFVYNSSWFVLAWNETVHNFGYFKLNRIETIKILNDDFTYLKTYKESDFIDEFGMKQNGDYFDIKLELTDLWTVVSERIYGKNQKLTKLDVHKTIFECSMQNKQMIKSFVLGFGRKAKVLSPDWLKEMIFEEIKQMQEEQEQ